MPNFLQYRKSSSFVAKQVRQRTFANDLSTSGLKVAMCDQECWCPGSITTHQPLDRMRCCKNTEIRAKGGKQKSGLVSEGDLVMFCAKTSVPLACFSK